MCYFAYEDVRVRAGSPCEPTAQMDLHDLPGLLRHIAQAVFKHKAGN